MNKLLSLSILLSGLFACKCPEKTTSATASGTNSTTTVVTKDSAVSVADPGNKQGTDEEQEEILRQPVHRLSVSFISIGEGTFRGAKGILDEYIRRFEEEHKVDITYATRPWGREGESDQLFLLNGLNGEQQSAFVEGVRQLFQGNRLVIIEENRPNKSVR